MGIVEYICCSGKAGFCRKHPDLVSNSIDPEFLIVEATGVAKLQHHENIGKVMGTHFTRARNH